MTYTAGPVTLVFLLVSVTLTPAAAQKHFSGPHVDVTTSREHVVGGSFINGIDVLSEDMQAVFSVGVGYRYQFDSGLVLGGSLSRGWYDGALNLDEESLAVNWESTSQWDWEVTSGWVLASQFHLFAFASEVSRTFDVAIRQGDIQFSQIDRQGMLRLGLGVEAPLVNGLSATIKLGTGRADFGDRTTSIDISRKAHAEVSLRYTH